MTDQIEHDPHEPPRLRPFNPLPIALVLVAGLWALSLYNGNVEWDSAWLGIGTGGLLAIWAIRITGDRIPDSWRPKPRRRT